MYPPRRSKIHLYHPEWNELTQVCEKHHLPQLPCPSCTADHGDPDLEIHLNETDLVYLDFGDNLADMVPNNLAERVRQGGIAVYG